MAKLIYSAIASLDGYVADADGNFDWAAPDEEVHAFVNDLERPVGTYLLRAPHVRGDGRLGDRAHRADQRRPMRDFAEIWRAADKVVYSTDAGGGLQRHGRGIERDFDPEAVAAAEGGARTATSASAARRSPAEALARRPGRRAPPVPHAGRGGRRHAGAARRRPRASSSCSTSAASATAWSTCTTARATQRSPSAATCTIDASISHSTGARSSV